MASQMIPNTVKVIVPSNTVTATGNSAAFSLPLADSYAIFLVATAASGTTPTLDVVLQTSPDGGTTWLNLPLRFAQLTTAGQSFIRFQPTLGLGEAASAGVVAGTGGALALNTPFIGSVNTTVLGASQQIPTMRFAATVAGTTPSFTYTAYVIMSPRGNITSN
jgi:hypothetical protein